MEYGYPSQPLPGYPFDGETMWRSYGAHDYDYDFIILAGGNMTNGAQGGPWILLSGYANGMTVGRTDDFDEISPYFGNEFLSVYNSLVSMGAT